MGINFSKRSQNKSVEKRIHPCEIYNTLDRHANKGYLRVPVQKTVLAKWFDEYQEKRDVILKLPTGEGKTIIGLLILQSKINQKKAQHYMYAQINISTFGGENSSPVPLQLGHWAIIKAEICNSFPHYQIKNGVYDGLRQIMGLA